MSAYYQYLNDTHIDTQRLDTPETLNSSGGLQDSHGKTEFMSSGKKHCEAKTTSDLCLKQHQFWSLTLPPAEISVSGFN